ERPRIREAKDVSAGKADGTSDAIAVFAQAVEGGIGFDREIHFRTGDEIVKIARRHFVEAGRVDEGGKSFFRKLWVGIGEGESRVGVKDLVEAGNEFIERGAPLGEATLLGGNVLAFVRDIIYEAIEGVEGDNAITFLFGKKKERWIKTAMGGACDLVAS